MEETGADFTLGPTDFDVQKVLADACVKAGLEDFGEEPFQGALGVLLAELDASPLNPVGRSVQRARIVDSLVVRLRFEAYCKRYPEILQEEIADPLVVVGQTRTGTTRLHRLLACDPKFYAPLWWEVRYPAPFSEADAFAATGADGPDPRIAEAELQVQMILETQPVLASIHPWDACGADEEIMLMEHAFLSHVPESSTHVPGYIRWIDEQDWHPAYRYLEKMLQFLQWQKKRRGEQAERWVLKTPQHLAYVDTLFERFPGALVIQTHRDPLATIPSSASMYSALHGLGQDEVDFEGVGRQCLRRFSWALSRNLAARARRKDQGFIDAWYADVGKDPMGEIRRIYEALGQPLTPEAERAMQQWLAENAREKRPPHEYTLEKFGLTREEIEREFAAYRERFILPRL